jgi:hypothetical protein
MVNCTATLNSIASYYAGLGTYIGLATGNPGSTSTPANEATGGSPSYARVATDWSSGSTGVQNGTAVTINVAEGDYDYMILASGGSGNNQVDNCAITTVIMSAQGQIVCNPVYTQT